MKTRQLTFILILFITLISCVNEQKKNKTSTNLNDYQEIQPTNSLTSLYKETEINYTYIENSQIHDYSNNWDIDGDKIPDKIQFWGNGGAHLAYCPLIHLSSSNKVFYFDYLVIDLPIYEIEDSLKTKAIGFSVFDFDKDGIKDIFINLDFKEKVLLKYDGNKDIKVVNIN